MLYCVVLHYSGRCCGSAHPSRPRQVLPSDGFALAGRDTYITIPLAFNIYSLFKCSVFFTCKFHRQVLLLTDLPYRRGGPEVWLGPHRDSSKPAA